MAAENSNEFTATEPAIDYLHPEVLSNETLIKILKEKMIKRTDELDKMSKCQLVELFLKYILPLPQRIYGSGRREKRLAERRSAKERGKRKAEDLGNEESKVKKSNEFASSPDRIKPPPSDDTKVIKMSSNITSHKNNSDTKNRHHKVNVKQCDEPLPTKKTKHQLITWP